MEKARNAKAETGQPLKIFIWNILLTAEELGYGTLWIANTCFAYHELADFIGIKGQLIGAVSLGIADEHPNPRPRKDIMEILEFR